METNILAVVLTSWLLAGGSLHKTECSRYCAAFDRGYEWAQENAIASEFECDGDGSAAFIAGCARVVGGTISGSSPILTTVLRREI
jgi:hypothetical protein